MLDDLHFKLVSSIADRFYFKSVFELPGISLLMHLPILSAFCLVDKLPLMKKFNHYVCNKLNEKQTLLEINRVSDYFNALVVGPGILVGTSAGIGRLSYASYGKKNYSTSVKFAFLSALFFYITCKAIPMIYNDTVDTIKTENMLHEAIATLAQMTTALKEVRAIVMQYPELTNIIPFQDFEKEANEEFKKLITTMEDESFTQQATWKTLKGKMMSALKLLTTVKYEFLPPYIQAGKVDALLSSATLYKQFETHPNARYYFANYEQSVTPHIKIDKFWNPFISPDTVVINSLELGTKTAYRNALITGPNAGGKSTALKAMAYAVLLAQTLTIANAHVSLTPFHKVFTTLNITDTTGKESLYQADKNRVKNVINCITPLNSDEFALIISDEMFNSTGASYGAALFGGTLTFITQNLQNTLFAAATHFESLVDLETETKGLVKNFRVEEASIGQNGKMTWTYKLKPGINRQNISFELAQEDGFDQRLIQASIQFLENHKAPAKQSSQGAPHKDI